MEQTLSAILMAIGFLMLWLALMLGFSILIGKYLRWQWRKEQRIQDSTIYPPSNSEPNHGGN